MRASCVIRSGIARASLTAVEELNKPGVGGDDDKAVKLLGRRDDCLRVRNKRRKAETSTTSRSRQARAPSVEHNQAKETGKPAAAPVDSVM